MQHYLFDSVDHKLSLQRLKYVEFSAMAMNWLIRVQWVSAENNILTDKKNKNGVPLGSDIIPKLGFLYRIKKRLPYEARKVFIQSCFL